MITIAVTVAAGSKNKDVELTGLRQDLELTAAGHGPTHFT